MVPIAVHHSGGIIIDAIVHQQEVHFVLELLCATLGEFGLAMASVGRHDVTGPTSIPLVVIQSQRMAKLVGKHKGTPVVACLHDDRFVLARVAATVDVGQSWSGEVQKH